eukprot:GHVO01009313.1.p1 GENE.GHVO01009313.1~~GHVO01009313.1.p1  ORF type:complete len:169 (-),score=26.27 GHVO01009313.1:85-591(-)
MGIYFESNGHGAIVLNWDKFNLWKSPYEGNPHCQFLTDFLSLANPAVGDSLVNMLAVEVSLRYLGIDHHTWYGRYTDYPCSQRQLKVPRPALDTIIVNPDHDKWIRNTDLQGQIDALVEGYRTSAHCRAFIRPSGTEDVCRLYVEGDKTEDMMNDLTDLVRRYFDSVS